MSFTFKVFTVRKQIQHNGNARFRFSCNRKDWSYKSMREYGVDKIAIVYPDHITTYDKIAVEERLRKADINFTIVYTRKSFLGKE